MSWDQVWRWIRKTYTTEKKTIGILEITDWTGTIKKYSTLTWNKQFVYGFKEWNFINYAGKVVGVNISFTKIMLLLLLLSRFSRVRLCVTP